LIHRRDEFRGDPITVSKVKKAKNIEMVFNSTAVEILGKEKFEGIVVENLATKEKRKLKVDAMFLEIGYILDTEWVKNFVERNEAGEIKTNKFGETKTEGIFAAGDVTDGPYKQTVTAAGEGAVAGLSAYNWLIKKEGKTAIKSDWS
jgi:thioredoxin reductase (NADPH)